MNKPESPRLQAICVFCGSSLGLDEKFGEAARALGRGLARKGITLVYGGGDVGLMGVMARACLAEGGRVIGVIPEHLLKVEAPDRKLTELIVVDSMHTRKRRMFDLSDAFCVLPGGLGTLDETFEILTWKQLKLHNKPVVLANIEGFWAPWLTMVEQIVADGFAPLSAKGLFSVSDSIEGVLASVEAEIGLPETSDSDLL